MSGERAWWRLTCRSCAEVGYALAPPAELAGLFRVQLCARCPECRREHPRQRRRAVVPEHVVPAWIVEWATEAAEYSPERSW